MDSKEKQIIQAEIAKPRFAGMDPRQIVQYLNAHASVTTEKTVTVTKTVEKPPLKKKHWWNKKPKPQEPETIKVTTPVKVTTKHHWTRVEALTGGIVKAVRVKDIEGLRDKCQQQQ